MWLKNFLGRVENIVGKGENAGYQHFLLYPQCFQKASSSVSLTLSQTSPGFHVSAVQSFENTVEKGEIARNEQFLLFPQFFLPDKRNLNYRLQTFFNLEE